MATILGYGRTISELDALAQFCREEFSLFVKNFWDEVPGTELLIWNWHIGLFCKELQEVAERVFKRQPKKHDLVVNVPFGTSKSSVISILYPAWVWTRMPEARFISATHTEDLVLDLAEKFRSVVNSEKYQQSFPYVKFESESTSHLKNTMGGDRLASTVGGKTPTGFHAHWCIVDDALDPQGARSDADLETASLYMTQTIPSRVVDKEVSVIILVMQRLHYRDPSSVLLKLGEKEGATPVRHICLPGELTEDVSPSIGELREIWPEAYVVDDLLDPKRLSRRVLTRYRETLSLYGYSAQVQQNPIPPGGGMFKATYFSQRVKASPYHAKRIRFWDRAATNEGGCFTAGTLMAKDNDGFYYVEHVVHGQWDPFERNRIIEATALKDRVRYGPNNEPIIYVESEGGSTGKESFQRLAAQLAGYRVREDRPTGSKDSRAEPWSTACAAGIVRLVDNGESKGLGKADWDINGYVEEMTLFKPEPGKRLGGLKDRVDASAGAYNLLAGLKTGVGHARVFSLSKKDPKAKGPRVIVCSRDTLKHTVIDERSVLCVFQNPPDSIAHEHQPLPTHGLNVLLAHVTVEFPDLNPPELQDRWEDTIPPWEKTASELIMTREHGKKVWSTILKKRDPFAECYVLCDDGDRRALSAAYAICDSLFLPRKTNLFVLGEEDVSLSKDAPNSHVYEMMRMARSLVVV